MAKPKLAVDNTTDDDALFDTGPEAMNRAAQNRLKSFVERAENVLEEIEGHKTDFKEIMAELKGEGFDVKIFKKVLKLRKMDPAKRQEEEALIDLYLATIGGL